MRCGQEAAGEGGQKGCLLYHPNSLQRYQLVGALISGEACLTHNWQNYKKEELGRRRNKGLPSLNG